MKRCTGVRCQWTAEVGAGQRRAALAPGCAAQWRSVREPRLEKGNSHIAIGVVFEVLENAKVVPLALRDGHTGMGAIRMTGEQGVAGENSSSEVCVPRTLALEPSSQPAVGHAFQSQPAPEA